MLELVLMNAARRLIALIFVSILISKLASAESANIVSKPVGLLKVDVAPGYNSLSMPLVPFDPSLATVFTNQLQGSTNALEADSVLIWNAAKSCYETAVKGADGLWYSKLSEGELTELQMATGEGFLILNRQPSNQTVLLSGSVPLDEEKELLLFPGLNLIGYPYPTAVALDQTELATLLASGADQIVPTNTTELTPGQSVWYHRKETNVTAWVEVRPYADIFPANDLSPRIMAIHVSDPSQVALQIAVSGGKSEVIEIYRKDVALTNMLDLTCGWDLAAEGILPEGRTMVEWKDAGRAEEPASYYLVARADIDENKNGIPDAREQFVMGLGAVSGKDKSDTDKDEAKDADKVKDGISTNYTGTNVVLVTRVLPGKVIYVDRNRGSDVLSGRTPVVVAADGPKKTIKAGLQTVESGDKMVIHDGVYAEDLNIIGKQVTVTIQGQVDLRETAPARVPPQSLLNENVTTNSIPTGDKL